MAPLTGLRRPAIPTFEPITTLQPEAHSPTRWINFRPLPVGRAFSSLLISPRPSCMQATLRTHAARPPLQLIYSSALPTPPGPPACAPSVLSQPDRSALALCVSSTNTSPTSPLDEPRRPAS